MLFQDAVGGGEGERSQPRRWKDWVLEKEMELRLEVPAEASIDVKVCEVRAVCAV